MTERTEDAQAAALRAFLLLCTLRLDWQGRLVLVRGLGTPGRGISVAASIHGAACLALDARPEVCRAALRAGACDFVVNSVDEALRILKNEIRKRKPVSVAVAMPEEPALEELAGRGVAPEASFTSAVETLDGACAYAAAHELAVHEFQFSSAQELGVFDQRLLAAIPEGDPRRRWAALASGFFYRERPFRRVAYLTAGEAATVG